MTAQNITSLVERALDARMPLFETAEGARHEAAFRLLNGFLEGQPAVVVDLYARTLVVFNYADDPASALPIIDQCTGLLLNRLPWVQAVIVKTRAAQSDQERTGVLVHGEAASRKVRENGVWYAVDLTLNRDASLYLDTRSLRAWALENLRGRRVLNTFAYTGSLGVAAAVGGARQVVQMDLNRRFLNLAKDSYVLNGIPIKKNDFITGDFFQVASRLKRSGELFDCVFFDPPFFSTTAHGKVDLAASSQAAINKIRPLVGHNGWLVAVNNSLFLSGKAYLHALEDLCADGYMRIESLIPVPPDITGYPETRIGSQPADPAPFPHSTKIAVLRITRKDGQSAS